MISQSLLEELIQEEQNSEKEIINMLNEMINLKRENNFMIKEIRLLEQMLSPFNANDEIINYNKKDLITDLSIKENILKPFIPQSQVEILYLIDNNQGRAKRRGRKVDKK